MSKKVSKSLIGAFVLGAIFLMVAGIATLGSGKLFKKTDKFVMYFPGNVKGLNVGAPVMFRWVKIGQVTDIKLRFNMNDYSALIPVYIEIDPSAATVVGGNPDKKFDQQAMIEKGLRGKLEMQSFVTGLYWINLDFYPDKPAKLYNLDKRYPEIPTIPAPMEELTKSIENLKLDQTLRKIESAVESIDKLVNSPDLKSSIVSLDKTMRDVGALARNIDSKIGPVSSSIIATSESAQRAFNQTEKTLALKEGPSAELVQNMKETFGAARLTLEETRKAVEGIRLVVDQNANMGYDLNKTTEEISALSRSLRSVTDYIDRHPEALLRGKTGSDGE